MSSRIVVAGVVYRLATSTRPTAEEVFRMMVDWNYFDPSEDPESSRPYADDIAAMYAALPEPIPVWRVIECEKECDIDMRNPGYHWTISLDSAREYAKEQLHGAPHIFLLSGKVASDQIDWRETINTYLDHPDEEEVWVEGEVQNVEIVGEL